MENEIYIIVPHKDNHEIVEQFISFSDEILQKYLFVYFIIIDDHSSDGTTLRLKEKFVHQSRVIFLNNKNVGVSGARNTGLRYVYNLTDLKNKWIIFCDFDDVVSPNIFSNFFNATILKKFDYVLFGFTSNEDRFRQCNIEHNIVSIKKSPFTDYYSKILGGTFMYGGINYNLNAPWAKIINVDFLNKNKIFFNENLTFKEDLVFNLEILKSSPNIGMLCNIYYYYYLNPNSTVRNYIQNINEQNEIVFEELEVLIPQNKSDLIKLFLVKSLVETVFLYIFSSNKKTTYIGSYRKFKEITSQVSIYRSILTSMYFSKSIKRKYMIIYILVKLKCFNILFLLMKLRKYRK